MSEFVYKEPGEIIADVIQSEMELPAGQVMFTNQKYFIPTEGVFVAVSYVGPSRTISSVNEAIDGGGAGLTEVQSLVVAHMVQIDILGYGNDVRRRKEEILMALRSLRSQALQEQYAMQIARNPSAFMDTSFLEATKMITRYTMTVMTTAVLEKRKAVSELYTDFSRAVPPLLTVDA